MALLVQLDVAGTHTWVENVWGSSPELCPWARIPGGARVKRVAGLHTSSTARPSRQNSKTKVVENGQVLQPKAYQ